MKTKCNPNGMTIAEVLVAVAGLGILILGFLSVQDFFMRALTQSQNKMVQNVVMNNIFESLRNRGALYQVDFDTSPEEIERILKVENLPWAWTGDTVVPAADCSSCTSRFGYVIQLSLAERTAPV